MYFSEFLLLIVTATIVTLILMLIGEKLIAFLIRNNSTPFYKIVGSFIFAIASVTTSVFIFDVTIDFNLYLLAGGIILLNKYWLGHFTEGKRNVKALTTYKEKVAE